MTDRRKESFENLRRKGVNIIEGPYGPNAKTDVTVAILARNPEQHSEQYGPAENLLLSEQIINLIPDVLAHHTAVENQGIKADYEPEGYVGNERVRYTVEGFLKKYGIEAPPGFYDDYRDIFYVVLGFPIDRTQDNMCNRYGVDGIVITYYFYKKELYKGRPARE